MAGRDRSKEKEERGGEANREVKRHIYLPQPSLSYAITQSTMMLAGALLLSLPLRWVFERSGSVQDCCEAYVVRPRQATTSVYI